MPLCLLFLFLFIMSPLVTGEKTKMGAKSFNMSSIYSRIVGLLNTTPNSPYYHSMTDVMGRAWIDFMIAKGANTLLVGDDNITAETLLGAGYLATRGWIPDLNTVIYKKNFNGLKSEKGLYKPNIGCNYMLHSEARKQKGPSDDEDGDKDSTAAIVMLAGAIASKHQSAQPSAIDFIRVYPDNSTYSVSTKKKLNFKVDTLASLLSREALGDQQYDAFFNFTAEEYEDMDQGRQQLIFKFELALASSNSSSSNSSLSNSSSSNSSSSNSSSLMSESTKYRIFRSDAVSSTLEAINIDASDLHTPRTCLVCLEKKKTVPPSTFSFRMTV